MMPGGKKVRNKKIKRARQHQVGTDTNKHEKKGKRKTLHSPEAARERKETRTLISRPQNHYGDPARKISRPHGAQTVETWSNSSCLTKIRT